MKKCLFILLIGCLEIADASTLNDFTGGYDVANWSQSLDGGSIDITGAPISIILTGSGINDASVRNTDFTITALGDGLVTFDWDYSTFDVDGPSADPFGVLLNGFFFQLTDNSGGNIQSNTFSAPVAIGDIFGVRVHVIDSGLGAATATISNFAAPGASTVPVPAAVWLFGSGLGLFVLLGRRSQVG